MKLNNPKSIGALVFVLLVGASLLVLAPTLLGIKDRRAQCFNNLNQIDSVVINVALANGYKRGTQIPPEKLTPYLLHDQLPVCPSGGHYSVPLVGGRPTCSYHGDLLIKGWTSTNTLLDVSELVTPKRTKGFPSKSEKCRVKT